MADKTDWAEKELHKPFAGSPEALKQLAKIEAHNAAIEHRERLFQAAAMAAPYYIPRTNSEITAAKCAVRFAKALWEATDD